MYSLVNVATVVRDLARHPDAPRVVEDLLRAFALDGAALAGIDAAPLDEAERARVRAAVAADLRGRPRALDVLAATRSVAETEGMRAWSVALDVLEDAAIGDCEELAAFVRREVLVDAWDSAGDLAVARHPRAIATVADGVAAAYAAPWSEAALALGAPWRRWLAAHDLPLATTAYDAQVAVLAGVATSPAVEPAPADWSLLMHDACWAVHLSGRERVAAVAQLQGLRALLSHCGERRPAHRQVAALVAATHATVVSDLLPEQARVQMTQPLLSLLH